MKKLFATSIEEPILNEFRTLCKAKRFKYSTTIERLVLRFNEENREVDKLGTRAATEATH